MKKILIPLLLLLASSVSAQFGRQSLGGAPGTESYVRGIISGDSGMVIKSFPDTATANRGPNIKKKQDLFIRVDSTIYYRDTAQKRWINLSGLSKGSVDSIININNYGTGCPSTFTGSVVHVSGMTFQNTPITVNIGCKSYPVAASIFTLPNALTSSEMWVIVYADTLGNVGFISGDTTPVSIPPLTDPRSQVLIATYNIPAGATQPAGISDLVIYDEPVSSWAFTSAIVGATDASITGTPTGAAAPYQGTYSTYTPAGSGVRAFDYTGSSIAVSDLTYFNFRIYLHDTMTVSEKIVISQRNTTYPNQYIIMYHGQYGFDGTKVNQWQLISIAKSKWPFPLAMVDINKVSFTLYGNLPAFQLDIVKWQSGGANTGGGTITIPKLVDSVSYTSDTAKFEFWDTRTGLKMELPTYLKYVYYDTCFVTDTIGRNVYISFNQNCGGSGGVTDTALIKQLISDSTKRFGVAGEDDTATSFRQFNLNDNAFNFHLRTDPVNGDSYFSFEADAPTFGDRFFGQVVNGVNGNLNQLYVDKTKTELKSTGAGVVGYVRTIAGEVDIIGDNSGIYTYTDEIDVVGKDVVFSHPTGSIAKVSIQKADSTSVTTPDYIWGAHPTINGDELVKIPYPIGGSVTNDPDSLGGLAAADYLKISDTSAMLAGKKNSADSTSGVATDYVTQYQRKKTSDSLLALIAGGGVNIYNTDGTLTGDRTLNADKKNLTIDSSKNFIVRTYPDTSANSSTALASGYAAIPTTGTDISLQNIYFLNLGQQSRIRQAGRIVAIQFYLNNKPATTLDFVVWRKSAGTYTRVSTQSILSLTTATTTNTVTLPTPVDVLEGDFTGFSYTNSSALAVFKSTAFTGSGAYYTTDPGASSDFTTGATAQNSFVPVKVTMEKSPVLVGLGNSIMSGSPLQYSGIETTIADSFQITMTYKTQAILGITGQSLGINGNTTTQMLARFDADVVPLHPKYVLLEGGINDVGSLASAVTISNYTSMFQKSMDNGIRPVMLLILPNTAYSNALSQKIDTINAALTVLAPIYGGIVVDARSTVGMFRSGGTAGNYWDIQTPYNYDGTHYTSAGFTAIAPVIAAAIRAASDTSLMVDSTGNTNMYGKVYAAKQVGIGTKTPNISAALDITSTSKGALMPRMTAVQRLAIASPAPGLFVFDLDSAAYFQYSGVSWQNLFNLGIDSLRRVGGSVNVEGRKNGVWTVQFVDSLGGGAGWGLTGNAGTNAATDFIGTTDNQNFRLKRNGVYSGGIDSTSATAGGTSFGFRTPLVSTVTAFGYKAASAATGVSNTAVGNLAFLLGTTSVRNTVMGAEALGNFAIASGADDNVAIGYRSLYNYAGGNSTAVGASALLNASYGLGNTGVGKSALQNVATSSALNTALGNAAGFFFTGSNNLTLSNSSIFIGANTVASANSSSNEIVVGTGTTGKGSNTATYGTTTTTDSYVYGKLQVAATSITQDTTAIAAFSSTTKVLLPPRMTTAQRVALTSGVVNATRAPGTGYTNGTYTAQALTGGTGTGATATLIISGGAVTSATIVSRGTGYLVNDVLSASGIGAGSGFTLTVTSLTAVTGGGFVYDLTLNQMAYWNTTAWVIF